MVRKDSTVSMISRINSPVKIYFSICKENNKWEHDMFYVNPFQVDGFKEFDLKDEDWIYQPAWVWSEKIIFLRAFKNVCDETLGGAMLNLIGRTIGLAKQKTQKIQLNNENGMYR